ncbi:MAG: hypothetical protein VX072_07375, partial [Pseudomonadota bacterium]|nr:hypothetical protein [Pseudomonadota bacterium]
MNDGREELDPGEDAEVVIVPGRREDDAQAQVVHEIDGEQEQVLHEHHPAHRAFAGAERAPHLDVFAQQDRHYAFVNGRVRYAIKVLGTPHIEHLPRRGG